MCGFLFQRDLQSWGIKRDSNNNLLVLLSLGGVCWLKKIKIEVSIIEDLIFPTPPSLSDASFPQKIPLEEDCHDRCDAHKKTKQVKVNLRSELNHYLEEDVMSDIK